MSGGKETPRQKMIGMMYLVLTALLALNVSKSILDAFVAIEENIQKANLTEVYRGNEKLTELKETSLDTENKERAAKAARLYKIAEKIDKISAERILEIDKLKIKILDKVGEDIKSVGGPESIIVKPYDKKNPLKPIYMNLSHVQGMDKYDEPMQIMIGAETTKPIGDGMDLWKSYNNYRSELCELIAKYPAGEGQKDFFFKSVAINKFKDQKDLYSQLDKAIKSSNVNQDDKEAIKKIYGSLTKEEFSEVHEVKGVHWIGKTFDHSPCVAAIASLSSMQKEILAARADAIALIRARVGGGEYSFNKIIALAYGPELANSGDDIEIQVLMAAYDSDKQPTVNVDGKGPADEIRDGKGFVRLKASGTNEMTVKGTITIRNKSGIPKLKNWEKTIKIMKPMGTIALPEMNVLYRGYSNKVEGVASGYDQSIVSGGGNVTISKSGTQWIASPGAGRQAFIVISGKSSLTNKTVQLGKFEFRVSNLPPPAVYLGTIGTGSSVSKPALGSMSRLFAKYPPEIPLSAAFEVASWEVTVSGAPRSITGNGPALTDEAKSLLKQARSGSKVSISAKYSGMGYRGNMASILTVE
jgi:gliding motility-associated protein GldM